jgi:hypothetical protein
VQSFLPSLSVCIVSETLRRAALDASAAHCRGCPSNGRPPVALTGGEPFVHPDIVAIIRGLLQLQDSHVVVLTNGMNLPDILSHDRFDLDRFRLQISVDSAIYYLWLENFSAGQILATRIFLE